MDRLDEAILIAKTVDPAKRRVLETAHRIKEWLNGKKIDLAVVLGSGLGEFGKDHSEIMEQAYDKLGLPAAGVPGHAGVLRYTTIGGRGVLLFSGRKHLYESGVDLDTSLLSVRAAYHAGAKLQILTCATGSVNTSYHPGQLVLIKDHINHLGVDPAGGFVDMTDAYDEGLRIKTQEIATNLFGQKLKEGVLTSKKGPSFETPAEIKMLRALGADMCGMSTIHETIALRALGARVLGITLITNYGAGIKKNPISHEEVQAKAKEVAPRFSELLTNVIARLV